MNLDLAAPARTKIVLRREGAVVLMRYDERLPLVFNHIPKTAGTAFTASLSKAIADDKVVVGIDRCLFGNFTDFDSIPAPMRQMVFLSSDEIPRDMKLVTGHLAVSTTDAAYPTAQRLTLLREPRVRVLSHWMYFCSLTEEALRPLGALAKYVRKSHEGLDIFLSEASLGCQIDNCITRFLLWPHPLIPSDGFILQDDDEDIVEQALQKIEKFTYVDVIENPDLEKNLRAWLGREFVLKPANKTGVILPQLKMPLCRELTTSALRNLEARSRIDSKLWAYVAAAKVGDAAAARQRDDAIIQAISRYAHMMSGDAMHQTLT